jgi:uncharacterized protein
MTKPNADGRRRLLDHCRLSIAGRFTGLPAPSIDDLDEASARIGAFVTLRAHDGSLRGCIGRILSDAPLSQTLGEIARDSAFGDRRFSPVRQEELTTITIEVSLLSRPEPVGSYHDIRLGVDGIILTRGGARALFLPEVATEQRWNLETTLAHLSRKAGLAADGWRSPECRFEVFQTVHFGERDEDSGAAPAGEGVGAR